MPEQKRFLSLDDLTHQPKPVWLIDGLFEANALVMLAGSPGSFKSFLALDWMLCMATGRKWNGRDTTPAKVLYMLGEGKASLLKRIQVWTHYHKLSEAETARLVENFRVTFEVPQMAAKSSVDNMLAELVAEDFTPSVMVVDTFNRSFVGLDENSAQDTGLWIEQADRLRQLGYTVLFLHHTAKNTEFGHKFRGSSAIMGAMDTAMTMIREGHKATVMVSKQKDHDEGPDMHFQCVTVNLWGAGEEGSCVLAPALQIDERFSDEFRKSQELIHSLVEDGTFENDAARAKKLAPLINISEQAAKTRISRWKQEFSQSQVKQLKVNELHTVT